ncbi:hypothetical protein VKT23_008126 [Stygiomarasmius scandens]|uniref:Uncharacterized protein n=1 Tax=Marasmiellus scandens TaxID=2682957 RepID=A0ABR1JHD0_9AGAR
MSEDPLEDDRLILLPLIAAKQPKPTMGSPTLLEAANHSSLNPSASSIQFQEGNKAFRLIRPHSGGSYVSEGTRTSTGSGLVSRCHSPFLEFVTPPTSPRPISWSSSSLHSETGNYCQQGDVFRNANDPMDSITPGLRIIKRSSAPTNFSSSQPTPFVCNATIPSSPPTARLRLNKRSPSSSTQCGATANNSTIIPLLTSGKISDAPALSSSPMPSIRRVPKRSSTMTAFRRASRSLPQIAEVSNSPQTMEYGSITLKGRGKL